MTLEKDKISGTVPRCGKEHRYNRARLYNPFVRFAFLPFGGESRYRQGFMQFAEIRAGERVLDACCGTGTLTHRIAEKVGREGEVIGVDLSTESLAVAESKKKGAGLPPAFKQASCADLPFPDGYFDLVFSDGWDLARCRCAPHAADKLHPGGWLVADDLEWNPVRSTVEPLIDAGWRVKKKKGPIYCAWDGQPRNTTTAFLQKPEDA